MKRRRLVSVRPPSLPTRKSPGRPRSETAHDAILAATVALVRDVGYDALTMEGVAARAGVGKATIYRRWASKEVLVTEAIGRIARAFSAPRTGSTEGDLLHLMRQAVSMYRDPASMALLSGLVAAMARNAPIADAVRTGFIATWRDAVQLVLLRGIARGDLRLNTDVDLALDLLGGPPFYRFLTRDTAIDDALAQGLVGVVLRGFAPHRHGQADGFG